MGTIGTVCTVCTVAVIVLVDAIDNYMSISAAISKATGEIRNEGLWSNWTVCITCSQRCGEVVSPQIESESVTKISRSVLC